MIRRPTTLLLAILLIGCTEDSGGTGAADTDSALRFYDAGPDGNVGPDGSIAAMDALAGTMDAQRTDAGDGPAVDRGPVEDPDSGDTAIDRGVAPDSGSADAMSADAMLADTMPDSRIRDARPPDQGCVPAAETCNQRDDDCDGRTDETFAVNMRCEAGMGACLQVGVTQCTEDGMGTTCSVRAGPGVQEACDEIDNDCDGQVDEGLNLMAPCVTGAGACARMGVLACGDDGQVTCQAEAVAGMHETCNGIDDDCDGRTDETAQGVNQMCESGELGACAAGRRQCRQGQLVCVQSAQPQAETCNGMDDDCDGRSDEDAANVGQNCNTALPGVCRAGRRECQNGRLNCASNRAALPETCDRTDEDCDGRVDEDAEGSGVACDPGWARPDCPRNAMIQCEAGALVCQRDAHPRDPCNGQDDDCDGRVGEDVRGMVCDTGQEGRCIIGALVCDGAEQSCSPTAEPECEIENGEDDDCDGETDEAPERFCTPVETQLTRSCLDDNNQFLGLDMHVDALGEIYISKGSIVQGHLYFSHVHRDTTQTRVRVASRVGMFPNSPLTDTSLVFHGGQPHICYRKARGGGLYVAQRDGQGDWSTNEVVDQGDAGADCALNILGGRLVMAYRQSGQLWFGERAPNGNWNLSRVDAPANGSVGHELALLIHNNTPYIAHRDTANRSLRLTYRVGNAWQSLAGSPPANMAGQGTGYRPALVITNGQLSVLHGDVPLDPDLGSDGNLWISTTGVPPGARFQTEQFDAEGHGGGQSVMTYETGFLAVARYRLRSALGFREDGLGLHKVTDSSIQRTLEHHSIADRRRTFTRLIIKPDPFGLPVIAFADEGGAQGDNGFGRVCFYRPNDADGDHVPDAAELERGTNPDVADTDGDGRTDGEELLIDGTDPLVR